MISKSLSGEIIAVEERDALADAVPAALRRDPSDAASDASLAMNSRREVRLLAQSRYTAARADVNDDCLRKTDRSVDIERRLTTSSVSGRGVSTSRVTSKSRPQNSRWPTICETGSRLRRRR
jgi:hypothetical protein